jgi:hypothetical protein
MMESSQLSPRTDTAVLVQGYCGQQDNRALKEHNTKKVLALSPRKPLEGSDSRHQHNSSPSHVCLRSEPVFALEVQQH